ncbi:hypothetical protein PoB_007420500 [Plakobranchus ocellatus]|uniref:Uncharacterized protein n=1 Tax=Plakobranchus ocellatus TaxID=259542 RepID=A0AAV4DUH8_9GAST|nr:hypothetical protein PoB_007420500 [Plakobranchus ocellatus]
MLPLIRPNPTPNNDRSILTAQSWFRIRRFPSGPKNINTMVERQRDMDSRYADDTAEYGEQLQKRLDTVVLETERMGLCLRV